MNIPHCLKTLLLVAAPVVIAICLSGCLGNVLWSPDSTEIFYSDKDGSRLVRYNLTSQASSVIKENTNTKTLWPAISPNGKQFAVCESKVITAKGALVDEFTLQIVFYSTSGIELKRSKTYSGSKKRSSAATDTSAPTSNTALSWSKALDHLFVWIDWRAPTSGCLIYDYAKDAWLARENANYLLLMGTEAFPPSGKGFIVCNKRLEFTDWDEWIQDFHAMPGRLDAMNFTKLTQEEAIWSGWDKSIGVIVTKNEIHKLDTESKQYSVEPYALSILPSEGEVKWIQKFQHGEIQLCVFKNTHSSEHSYRLEMQSVKSQKRKVVTEGNDWGAPQFMFFVSPDGDKVAFRANQRSGKNSIIIIDNKGAIVASVVPE